MFQICNVNYYIVNNVFQLMFCPLFGQLNRFEIRLYNNRLKIYKFYFLENEVLNEKISFYILLFYF